jgi:hypothetical protein
MDPAVVHDLHDESAATLSREPRRRDQQRWLWTLPLSLNPVQVTRRVVLQGRQGIAFDVVNVVQWVVEEFVHVATQRHVFDQRVGVVATVVKVLLDNLSLLLDDYAKRLVALKNLLSLHGLFRWKAAVADLSDCACRARERRAVVDKKRHHHRDSEEDQLGRSSAMMRTRARANLFLERKIAAQSDRTRVLFTAGSEVTTPHGDCRER